MMAIQELKPSFSNVQLELLKLYASGISDEDLQEVKQLLSEYFARKANDEMDAFIADNKLSAEDLIQWSKEDNRSENRS